MEIISRVKELILQNCRCFSSVVQFCEEVNIPYHTLRKLFRREVGMSMSEYYQKARLNKAEELLSDPDLRIFEVATEMGFKDDSYFSKWFKRMKGMAPTVFRQQLAGGGRLLTWSKVTAKDYQLFFLDFCGKMLNFVSNSAVRYPI